MRNWKTSVAGVLTGVGLYLSVQEDLAKSWRHIGNVAAICGSVLMGAVAKDFNVTGTKQTDGDAVESVPTSEKGKI